MKILGCGVQNTATSTSLALVVIVNQVDDEEHHEYQHSDEEHNILMTILRTQNHIDGQNVHPEFQGTLRSIFGQVSFCQNLITHDDDEGGDDIEGEDLVIQLIMNHTDPINKIPKVPEPQDVRNAYVGKRIKVWWPLDKM
ncbi:hypothetical protein MTR_7g033960 [Medicago truncatula]|uniref:Uncharacterized protein n=1 Tax=Medicago truncatula TaxID=3880 RepID=A0A072U8I5_MEDTR|nr:hypothetical protein MTR_7g033960 [Medicago truncatula]